MSKTQKKNGIVRTRTVRTHDVQPHDELITAIAMEKGSDGRWLLKDDIPTIIGREIKSEPFLWRTGASWTSTLLAPVKERRTEQIFVDAQKALCETPAFREEIVEIRNRLRSLVPKLGTDTISPKLIAGIATRICELWKILGSEPWVASLLIHWDPNMEKYPPRSVVDPSEGFDPWIMEVHKVRESAAKRAVGQYVTVTYRAGISKREIARVSQLVHRHLDARGRQTGRPPVSDRQRQALRAQFERIGKPKPQQRKAMILKVQKACRQLGIGRFSQTFIGGELRQWLREKGEPVKRYATEPSAKRRKPS
jgi:hypothetical protein